MRTDSPFSCWPSSHFCPSLTSRQLNSSFFEVLQNIIMCLHSSSSTLPSPRSAVSKYLHTAGKDASCAASVVPSRAWPIRTFLNDPGSQSIILWAYHDHILLPPARFAAYTIVVAYSSGETFSAIVTVQTHPTYFASILFSVGALAPPTW